MSQASQFIISEFTNPSGEIVFRVTGWLDGTRIRKNFPIRAEASAERQALEIQRLQAETGIRTTATRLTALSPFAWAHFASRPQPAFKTPP